MSTPHYTDGMSSGEPKDGDFVAYLAEIERRQLLALPTHAAHTSPTIESNQGPQGANGPASYDTTPLSAAQAEALRAKLKQGIGDPKHLVVAAFFGLLGLVLLVQGLLGDGGIVTLMIGAFLLWRAAVSLRKAAGANGMSQRDLATRLVNVLRDAQQNQARRK
jgi:hypothetical protein